MNRCFLLAVLFLYSIVFSQNSDSVFVPSKPEKPLRFCTAMKNWIQYAKQDSNLIEITKLTDLQMDLRYATFNNITGYDLYCGMQRTFVHKDAFVKLKLAMKILRKEMPGSKIVIFDAARPMYAQAALKSAVAGTAYSNYVSSGKTGGLHNYGLAIDISITDEKGNLLDMGTDFDSFERCAGASGEDDALKSGRLTAQQLENRKKLRNLMKKAGWISLDSEWWHFNAYTRAYVKENYSLFPL